MNHVPSRIPCSDLALSWTQEHKSYVTLESESALHEAFYVTILNNLDRQLGGGALKASNSRLEVDLRWCAETVISELDVVDRFFLDLSSYSNSVPSSLKLPVWLAYRTG